MIHRPARRPGTAPAKLTVTSSVMLLMEDPSDDLMSRVNEETSPFKHGEL